MTSSRPEPGAQLPGVERHYSVQEIAVLWNLSPDCVRKIFENESGVLVIGYSYGYFRAKDILRLGLVMSAVDSLLLLIIVPFYWPLIGIH